MKLYHGTNIDFFQIDFTKSKLGKDFGIGFYLTPEKEIAHKQAERKYEQFETGVLCRNTNLMKKMWKIFLY